MNVRKDWDRHALDEVRQIRVTSFQIFQFAEQKQHHHTKSRRNTQRGSSKVQIPCIELSTAHITHFERVLYTDANYYSFDNFFETMTASEYVAIQPVPDLLELLKNDICD